jgi:DMSO/TMAO reductase YedYZ molybdopterin-dependent catalytic subunit
VGELTSTTRWTGVPLKRLLSEWGLQDTASHLRITSADAFLSTSRLERRPHDERIMLAYEWDGVPLRVRHGFSAPRLHPRLYGMKQPK